MPSAYAHPDDPARAQQRVLHLRRPLAAGEALGKAALAEDFGVSAKTVQRNLAAAFERIGCRLPEAVRERHRLVSDAIHFGGLPPPAIDPAVWDAPLMAIQAREVVRID